MKEGELVGEKGWGRPVKQQMKEPAPKNTEKTMEAITQPRSY